MKLALYKCKKNIDVVGRNEDGSPDRCFKEGKEYLFCYDAKKSQVFIINEVGEYDISAFDLMEHEFTLIEVGEMEEFELDDLTKQKYKRLFRERGNYEE